MRSTERVARSSFPALLVPPRRRATGDAQRRPQPDSTRPHSVTAMTTTLPCAPAGATRVDSSGTDAQPARPARPSTRHTGLDALRGIAAFVVVIHHVLLLSPTFNGGTRPSWLDTLMHSPLHLLIDGTAAVWVFFVLSGVVVMMPVASWTRRQWATYLPKRLIRLWLPAAASVPIALTLWFVAFRDPVDGESHWSAAPTTSSSCPTPSGAPSASWAVRPCSIPPVVVALGARLRHSLPRVGSARPGPTPGLAAHARRLRLPDLVGHRPERG